MLRAFKRFSIKRRRRKQDRDCQNQRRRTRKHRRHGEEREELRTEEILPVRNHVTHRANGILLAK